MRVAEEQIRFAVCDIAFWAPDGGYVVNVGASKSRTVNVFWFAKPGFITYLTGCF